MSYTTEASPITRRPRQPSPINVIVTAGDKTQSPHTNTKRDRSQDQSPLLEEDSPKRSRLSEVGGLGLTISVIKLSPIFPV